MEGLIGTVAGLIGELSSRLSSTWSAKLDSIAADYLQRGTWTQAHADRILWGAQDKPPIGNGIISGGAFTGSDANGYGLFQNSIGMPQALVTQASLTDVVNIASGRGALLFCSIHHGATGPQAGRVVITRDSVVEYDGNPAGNSVAYAMATLVGACPRTGNLSSSGFSVTFDYLPFFFNLRIQAMAGTSGQFRLAYRYRLFA